MPKTKKTKTARKPPFPNTGKKNEARLKDAVAYSKRKGTPVTRNELIAFAVDEFSRTKKGKKLLAAGKTAPKKSAFKA